MQSSPSPSGIEAKSGGRLSRLLSHVHLFDSLAFPGYRSYATSMLLFFAAMQMMTLLRPWLAYELSSNGTGQRSAIALGITFAASSLPNLILAPWAGALADRTDMRKILQVCAVILAGLSLLIAIGVATDAMQWWHVALVALCQGCVMTFVTPTRRAIVSVLVDQQHLFNAVSLHTTTLTANRMVAPAIAGFLIDGAGVPVAAVVSAGLYLGTMLLLFPVPESRRHLRTREASFVTDIREGIRYAVRETTVRNLLLIGFVGSVFGAPIQELLPLFQSVLNISASGIGLLLTAMGVGSLLASTTAASLGDFKHKGLLLIGFLALLGAAIIAFSVSSTFLLSLPFMVLVGMGQSGRLAVHLTTLQIYSDPDMRGRVQSLNSMQSGFAPFAVLLITALAEAFSPQWAMGISGLIVVMYCIWEFICNKRIRELE